MATNWEQLHALNERISAAGAVLRELEERPLDVWDALSTADTATIRAAWCLRREEGLFAPTGLYNYGVDAPSAIAEEQVTIVESALPAILSRAA